MGDPRHLGAFALALAALAPACARQEREVRAISHAEAVAAPYTEDFSRFDRWARRGMAAERIRSKASIEESLFAPIRRDAETVAVWVERKGAGSLTLTFRTGEEAPPDLAWVELREVLGGIQVAVARVPDGRGGRNAPPVRAVLLSRTGPASEGGTVRVTVAYAAPEG